MCAAVLPQGGAGRGGKGAPKRKGSQAARRPPPSCWPDHSRMLRRWAPQPCPMEAGMRMSRGCGVPTCSGGACMGVCERSTCTAALRVCRRARGDGGAEFAELGAVDASSTPCPASSELRACRPDVTRLRQGGLHAAATSPPPPCSSMAPNALRSLLKPPGLVLQVVGTSGRAGRSTQGDRGRLHAGRETLI